MTKTDIAELSAKIRRAFSITTPVDLNSVVEQLGGEILYLTEEETDNKEAYIKPKNIHNSSKPFFEIGILQDVASQKRARFSIAHELGHLFLHLSFLNRDKWSQMVTEGKKHYRYGSSKIENEANTFSACFLMPEIEFKLIVISNTDDDGYTNIDEIAKHFQVSYSAALNRGRWLEIFDWD